MKKGLIKFLTINLLFLLLILPVEAKGGAGVVSENYPVILTNKIERDYTISILNYHGKDNLISKVYLSGNKDKIKIIEGKKKADDYQINIDRTNLTSGEYIVEIYIKDKLVGYSQVVLEQIGAIKPNNISSKISPNRQQDDRKAQGYQSKTNYLILVNIKDRHVNIYKGQKGNWQRIKDFACSPGAPETPTIKGIGKIYRKGYYFDSEGDRCFYYSAFNGPYYFHSVLYYPTKDNLPTKIVDGRVGLFLSHGCVRLEINNAKYIYDNIPINTAVVTF